MIFLWNSREHSGMQPLSHAQQCSAGPFGTSWTQDKLHCGAISHQTRRRWCPPPWACLVVKPNNWSPRKMSRISWASLIRKLYVHVCSIFLSKHLSLSLGIHEGELCIQGAQQQANVAGEVWMGLCDHHIAGLAIQSQKLMIRFP